jgi:hypothetical protein
MRAVVISLLLAFLHVAAQGQFGQLPNGQPLRELAPPGTHTVALFFVASDCPISDRTFPEMRRVREQFSSRGVKFYFVYPNSTERVADVTAHQRDFDPGGDILLDPTGELIRLAHARVTPEAAVIVDTPAGWRLTYSGGITDRYIHLGLERPRATRDFVEEALSALLSGKPVPAFVGNVVGCGIINPAINGVTASR